MYLQYYSEFDGQPRLCHFVSDRVRIGSDPTNNLVLEHALVDPVAAEICYLDRAWHVYAVGSKGIQLDGTKLHSGDSLPWAEAKSLSIYPYVFHLEQLPVPVDRQDRKVAHEIHELIRNIHVDYLNQIDHRSTKPISPESMDQLIELEHRLEKSAVDHGIASDQALEIVRGLAGDCVRDAVLAQTLGGLDESESVWHRDGFWRTHATSARELEHQLNQLSMACLSVIFKDIEDNAKARVNCLENSFPTYWMRTVDRLPRATVQALAIRQLKKLVKDILFGYGPLEDLLRSPTVTEIMVNASDEIMIERDSVLQNSGRQFLSDDVTLAIAERIVNSAGRRIDTSCPMVDAKLEDGSRVNVVSPPLAVRGPTITIRKANKRPFAAHDLITKGTLTAQALAFLQASIRDKRSMLISGGTSSGKTTLLKILAESIPDTERVICIEDTNELKLNHPHVLYFECRNASTEGTGRVSIRDLLTNALRQRPDRLIVGECRGDETLDMLQAMNTGHDGSMSTIHANGAADALRRLEVLVRESGLPSDTIRQQIVSAIDIVVQIERLPSGKRIVSEISEVSHYDEQNQCVQLRTIFEAVPGDHEKVLIPTGCLPTFACQLVDKKFLELELFF